MSSRRSKTAEKDGYEAVQLGFGLDKRLNQPERGHRKASGFMSRTLREVKADDVAEFEVGQVIKADAFADGELVDVIGTSKGRGFQGGVKRHGFSGGPKTHGQSDRLRAPGSIGSSATPGRVFKGMRMAGPHGRRAGDGPEPEGAARRYRAQSAAGSGIGARAEQGLVIVRARDQVEASSSGSSAHGRRRSRHGPGE